MEIVGLQGSRVRLVPPERSQHLDNALRWMNDPVVNRTLVSVVGVSRKQEEAFFDRIEASRDGEIHWAILDETGRHIGMTGLSVHWPFRTAKGGLCLGEPEVWGRGYATEVLRLRTDFAFKELGLHRIEGHTINPSMRRVYEKTAYRHEGTALRKIWRDGEWKDVDFFAILESDRDS